MIEIGSSEAPVILGVSPHETPWHLWAVKVGLIPRMDELDEVMRAGKKLEPVVLDMALDDLGVGGEYVALQDTQYHPERKWQRSTPDGTIRGDCGSPREIFEVKNVVTGPPSTPRVEWVVRCLHHLLVHETANVCHLVAFGALRMVRWKIPRHAKALDAVLRAEEAFLELVETETPPPVNARDGASLWRRWPLTADETVMLPPEALAWDAQLVQAEQERGDATARYEAARTKIRYAMGPKIRAVLPDASARYSWTPNKKGVRSFRRSGREE